MSLPEILFMVVLFNVELFKELWPMAYDYGSFIRREDLHPWLKRP